MHGGSSARMVSTMPHGLTSPMGNGSSTISSLLHLTEEASVERQENRKCEHCGIENETVRPDHWGNVLCERCAHEEAEAEWKE